jgi:hypothetical protein
MDYIQFIPGVVIGNVTAKDSPKFDGDLRRIGSIRAMPHFGVKGIKKKSMLGEEYRYWPLLRGIQETPTPGDPVLLCDIGGVKYYLGPLNTQGKPNFNKDRFGDDEIRSGEEAGIGGGKESETPAFVKQDYKRLQKFLNPSVDNPLNPDGELSKVIHGDLVLEGRHGNSIRIGSRNINPYIIISNNRIVNNPIETTLDGTILGIFKQGTIRNHFNMDNKKGEKYEFTLADDEVNPNENGVGQPISSISKTFTKPLGRGLVDDPANEDPDINKTIYEYSRNQFFLSSDRITFNAKQESIFISALQHIHVGSGNTMTFSTSKSSIFEVAERFGVNTKLFKVDSGFAAIDGRDGIILGAPELGDNPNRAVVGDALVDALASLSVIIKGLASATSTAIENRAKVGGSMDYMQRVHKELDAWVGKNGTKLEEQILSKRVYIAPY